MRVGGRFRRTFGQKATPITQGDGGHLTGAIVLDTLDLHLTIPIHSLVSLRATATRERANLMNFDQYIDVMYC